MQQDAEELALWAELAKGHSSPARTALFQRFLPLAKRIAARFTGHQFGGSVAFDELLQMASSGLLEAIDRYDVTLGVPFRYFASRRMRGSILNELAKLTEVNQQISTRSRITRERARSLQPDPFEGGSLEASLTALGDLAEGLALGLMLEQSGMYALEDRDPTPNAYDSLAWKQAVNDVRSAVDNLPERERVIMRMHYLDGIAFGQISAAMELSKGRVSQLHSQAIALLRKRLLKSGKIYFET